jgi:hypothetical protein
MSPCTWWKRAIAVSTIGRKPTGVPVRGKHSSAAKPPWPVPNVKTSFLAAIESAHVLPAAAIASACVLRNARSRSIVTSR